MKYICPKCGKHIEMSAEALIAAQYKTVCPQCLTQLEIVGDYAYVPLDDGSLELRRHDDEPTPPVLTDTETTLMPPPVPQATVVADTRDPLLEPAARYLAQCNAITPMMLRDRFGISLERAQQLMEQLEQAGYVGPYRGGAPREILVEHRAGLPNPYQYGQPVEEAPPQDGAEQRGGKVVTFNCSSCLLWLVIIAAVIFLFVK